MPIKKDRELPAGCHCLSRHEQVQTRTPATWITRAGQKHLGKHQRGQTNPPNPRGKAPLLSMPREHYRCCPACSNFGRSEHATGVVRVKGHAHENARGLVIRT
eukprot:601275-Pelagomonas_calceolata.AAC.1